MTATVTPAEEAQLNQTIEMFEVITQSQPTDYQSLEILKEAYLKLGRQQDLINTSKRIAQAYVQLGQLSSAILEYETILQRTPEDPEVVAALKEIETQANKFSAQPEPETAPRAPTAARPARATGKPTPATVEDGRADMLKAFVESKLLAPSDFDQCWGLPDLATPPLRVVEPFALNVINKKLMLEEPLLKVLSDRSRLAYLPLGKYDMDLELARSFPAATCRRWCVLPFDRMSKSIFVATANPFNRQAAKELHEATPNRVVWYLTSPAELATFIQRAFR
jgi:tetratricopeptide (TPR) repeat protein